MASLADNRCLLTSASTSRDTSQGQRKLVLHVDIQNTVTLVDSLHQTLMSDALNCYITTVVWGKKTETGQWVGVSGSGPSLQPPGDGFITYYTYMEQKLQVTNQCKRELLKDQLRKFTTTEAGKPFKRLHQEILSKLQVATNRPDDDPTVVREGSVLYHLIFPSFLKLINHLQVNQREFAIIFRTYGNDAGAILGALKYLMNTESSVLASIDKMPTHKLIARLDYSNNSIFLHAPWVGSNGEPIVFEGDCAIYKALNSVVGICAVQDNYHFWRTHNYDAFHAKPFWIDSQDQKVQHIFFDDNLRVNEPNCIVTTKVLHHTCQSVSVLTREEASIYLDTCLVQSNLLDAVNDENYFIDKVKLCEDNYSKGVSIE